MKPIPDYPNYHIDSNWNIYSFISNKYIKWWKTWWWYLSIFLFNDYWRKRFYIHRLVMLCYHWASMLDVNHIDWDKYNNKLSNLEYCTKSENMLHSINILWKKHNNDHMKKMNKISCEKYSKKVLQISIDWKIINLWNSILDASRSWFTKTSISDCCNWKQKIHKNFIWKFNQ